MHKGRLEAFSDGVIAILLTIMVLELKTPHGHDFEALKPLLPTLLSYLMSFVFIGVYWNNHHHLMHATSRINGRILWANLHLLFWLSLVSFATAWLGEAGPEPLPTAVYGAVMMFAGVAYFILQGAIIADQGPDSRLKEMIGPDIKGKTSAVLLISSVPLAFVHPYISIGIYLAVLVMWFIPDRRIERHTHTQS
jgi:uncharacterized membrane protein